MQVINKQNVFTNSQLEQLIKLMGRDYRPRRVIVYETRWDMLRYYPRCFNFSREEFCGQLEGSYDQSSDTVYVCVFSQNDDGDDLHSKQLYSIHALAHELRHRYQYVKNFLRNDDEKSEGDADRFATGFVNNNSRRISKIMGWKEEWTVAEEN